ncbi:hypothetical protein [Halocatena halophila]|uniref:hypothetical protein n=1 Tax=Halocatena halophila TaxID=2814576 RepID=UPI002ED5DA5F
MSTSSDDFSDVSRDPADYAPTTHFKQQRRKRSVAGWKIRDAIENGTIEKSEENEDCVVFNSDYINLVVALDGDVITVYNNGGDVY